MPTATVELVPYAHLGCLTIEFDDCAFEAVAESTLYYDSSRLYRIETGVCPQVPKRNSRSRLRCCSRRKQDQMRSRDARAGLRHCVAFDENLYDSRGVRFDNYKTKRSLQNVL